MQTREIYTRKHIHTWKLTLSRVGHFSCLRWLERECTGCGVTHNACVPDSADLPPGDLLALADVEWCAGRSKAHRK
jgi:hypothetical protein